jgi:acetyl esterase/lipase
VALAFDPDFLQAAATAVADGMPVPDRVGRDDARTLRANGDASLAFLESTLPPGGAVERTDHRVTGFDRGIVPVRWYRPPPLPASQHGVVDPPPPVPGPAAVYAHGGGMVSGSIDGYDRWIAGYVLESGVPMLAVDYRLAPEHPHPTPVEDVFSSLVWLIDHAVEFGVDPARIAIMGDSAGGGLAAGAAVLARDRDVELAHQILIYPMLDDRNTTPREDLLPFAGWSYDDNFTGWHALLGDIVGTDAVPAAAAPARAEDLSGVAPIYLDVGELDIFRDECLAFASVAAAAGTPVELHVHAGCPHGFDRFTTASVARRARQDRIRVLRSL